MIGYLISLVLMIQAGTKGEPLLFVAGGLFAVAGAIILASRKE